MSRPAHQVAPAQVPHGKKASKPATVSASLSALTATPLRRLLVILVIAFVIGLVHIWWSRLLLENLRWWSTRSLLQKETSLYSEQAMYYRYYKEGVQAKSLGEMWSFFTNDTGIQYPDQINALQRYNVYPEFFLAIIYRMGMTSYREPIDFYADAVHFLNAFFAAGLFISGTFLSGSIAGGLVSVAMFAYNYSHSTRAYWSFPLREAFGNPFWFCQVAILTFFLARRSRTELHFVPKRLLLALFGLCTFGFAISWQFAPFTLFTQVVALFLLYGLGGISQSDLGLVLGVEAGVVFLVGFVFQFVNEFTLNSLFLCSAVVALLLTQLIPRWILFASERADVVIYFFERLIRLALAFVVFMALSLGLKFVMAEAFHIHSDDHIFDIMRAKFTSYSDFHTNMYMKQKEYRALHGDEETVRDVMASLIAPTVLSIAAVLMLFIVTGKKLSDTITYNWLQYMAATLKAGLIMRLKLFWMPYNAIMASLLVSDEAFDLSDWLQSWVGVPKNRRAWVTWAALAILFALMTSWAAPKLKTLYEDEKEWNHEDLQALMTWIKKNTPPKAVFSSDMGHSSNIVCSTGRRVTNHPHYESADIRNRTEVVYRMYECRPVEEVYKVFKELGTEYVMIFHIACKDNRMREADCYYEDRACYKIEHDPKYQKYFTLVHNQGQGQYLVYKVK